MASISPSIVTTTTTTTMAETAESLKQYHQELLEMVKEADACMKSRASCLYIKRNKTSDRIIEEWIKTLDLERKSCVVTTSSHYILSSDSVLLMTESLSRLNML